MTWKTEHDAKKDWIAIQIIVLLFAVLVGTLLVIDRWEKNGKPPLPIPPQMTLDKQSETPPIQKCPVCGRPLE